MKACLRALQIEDLAQVRQWRNHPEINRFMFSQHEIQAEEHQKWFEASQTNLLRALYVYEEDGLIKGFVQLQKKSQDSAVFEWGFYIDPQAKKGTGTKMAYLTLKKVFTELAGDKVFGEVLSYNYPSIKFHQKLGFLQEGLLRNQHLLNGQYYDVHCFGLLKDEWQTQSEKIISLKDSTC